MFGIGGSLHVLDMATINFACYNMYGFDNGYSALTDLCKSFDIIAVEEHWLAPYNLDKLRNFNAQFDCFCWSSMSDKIELGLNTGRPFGGIGILFNKRLGSNIRVLGVMSNGRCAVVQCTFPSGYSLILAVVYFPCLGSSTDYECDLTECLGFVETCVNMSIYDDIIVLGDMNFDTSKNNIGSRLFHDFCADIGLKRADSDCRSQIECTYYQETTCKQSIIDHIFISNRLTTCVKRYFVIDDIANLSDHYPLGCEIVLINHSPPNHTGTNRNQRSTRWRWDKADLDRYYSITSELLQRICIPKDLLVGSCGMFDCVHWRHINDYYDAIVNVLHKAMVSCVPRCKENYFRFFWNDELRDLKQASVEAYQLWRQCDKPKDGIVNKIRLEAKYKYKIALRQAMNDECMELDDELSNLYLRKDMNKFWQRWNAKFSAKNMKPSNVNGLCKDDDIANCFSDSFASVYFDSYKDNTRLISCLDNLHTQILSETTKGVYDGSNLFSVTDVEDSLSCVKSGKASGLDDLCKETILYAHPALIVHLKFLFNIICTHGFVPDAFGQGVTVPIIKDRLANASSTSNYRPITLSPIISKIFEYCILHKYEHFFFTDQLQFGFKRDLSCSHALFVLSQTVNYFVQHGSNVFMAALDARKAFDRVNHLKLFEKLIARGFPAGIVKVLMDWYGKTFSCVKWGDCYSDFVSVRSGIRQGGILSPMLFNIYINSLIGALRSSDLGCHLGNEYVGCIVYADDIILLSASLIKLQKMLDICYLQGSNLDIQFNVDKSYLFIVGHSFGEMLPVLRMNDVPIAWTDSLKYLGVKFISDKRLNTDISPVMRKFYAAANAIFSHCKYVSQFTKLHLLESFTLPMLTYGLNAICLSRPQLMKLNSCWNSIYRKIFGYFKWESVKEIQMFCQRLDFVHIVDKCKFNFLNNFAAVCKNSVLFECLYAFQHSDMCRQLYVKYSACIGDVVHCSLIFQNFSEQVMLRHLS